LGKGQRGGVAPVGGADERLRRLRGDDEHEEAKAASARAVSTAAAMESQCGWRGGDAARLRQARPAARLEGRRCGEVRRPAAVGGEG
jgi:hypothetical protein